MEGKRQMGTSSSASSFTADLFGTREPPPSSSAGIFASMFPHPSKVTGRTPSNTEYHGNQGWNNKQGSSASRTEAASYNNSNKNKSSMFHEERSEPCHLSSSIYYGGQDIYSRPTTNQTTGTYPTYKKDGGGNDSNGNNSEDASRGNWWQGSLYY